MNRCCRSAQFYRLTENKVTGNVTISRGISWPQAMNKDPLAAQTPVISMRGIDKFFGGVTALEDVDLDAYAGEVLAIVCLLYTSPSPRDS